MHRFNGARVLCCAPQAPLRSAALPITRQISLLQSGSELRFCLSKDGRYPTVAADVLFALFPHAAAVS